MARDRQRGAEKPEPPALPPRGRGVHGLNRPQPGPGAALLEQQRWKFFFNCPCSPPLTPLQVFPNPPAQEAPCRPAPTHGHVCDSPTMHQSPGWLRAVRTLSGQPTRHRPHTQPRRWGGTRLPAVTPQQRAVLGSVPSSPEITLSVSPPHAHLPQ